MDVQTLQSLPWFQELLVGIRAELNVLVRDQTEQRPALQHELEDLREQKAGWSQSLGNPNLSPSLRREFEQNWEKADEREIEIEQSLSEQVNQEEFIDRIFCPVTVTDRLRHLDEVLASHNPTLGNLELSLHIDRIDCFEDGRVVMRTCRLGALADATLLLRADSEDADYKSSVVSARRQSTPRRRTKLRVDTLGTDRHEATAAAEMAADPNRFAGLDERWFWHDEFQIPRRMSWAEDHALEVARCRIDEKMTHLQLEDRFGKTVPTIRQALQHAATADPVIAEQLAALPNRMPRARWHEDHAVEVFQKAEELKRETGTTQTPMAELVRHFGKSDATLRKALEFARQRSVAGHPDSDVPDRPQDDGESTP